MEYELLCGRVHRVIGYCDTIERISSHSCGFWKSPLYVSLE
jgi:hypothetical protein